MPICFEESCQCSYPHNGSESCFTLGQRSLIPEGG